MFVQDKRFGEPQEPTRFWTTTMKQLLLLALGVLVHQFTVRYCYVRGSICWRHNCARYAPRHSPQHFALKSARYDKGPLRWAFEFYSSPASVGFSKSGVSSSADSPVIRRTSLSILPNSFEPALKWFTVVERDAPSFL